MSYFYISTNLMNYLYIWTFWTPFHRLTQGYLVQGAPLFCPLKTKVAERCIIGEDKKAKAYVMSAGHRHCLGRRQPNSPRIPLYLPFQNCRKYSTTVIAVSTPHFCYLSNYSLSPSMHDSVHNQSCFNYFSS